MCALRICTVSIARRPFCLAVRIVLVICVVCRQFFVWWLNEFMIFCAVWNKIHLLERDREIQIQASCQWWPMEMTQEQVFDLLLPSRLLSEQCHWPVLISYPTQRKRLIWPRWLVTYQSSISPFYILNHFPVMVELFPGKPTLPYLADNLATES